LATPYVRPQENGNRMHARRLSLSDGAGRSLTVTGHPHVDFAVRPWSPELLTAARHAPDLVPDGRTYLHLDAAPHGIGSGSLRPRAPPAHPPTPRPAAPPPGFSAGPCPPPPPPHPTSPRARHGYRAEAPVPRGGGPLSPGRRGQGARHPDPLPTPIRCPPRS